MKVLRNVFVIKNGKQSTAVSPHKAPDTSNCAGMSLRRLEIEIST